MRNLHRVGLRYNSPVFLAVLAQLNIDVCPEQDKSALRRFLMGDLMVVIPEPVRALEKQTITIPVQLNETIGIDAFFDDAKAKLLSSLAERGINPDKVQGMYITQNESGQSVYEVDIMVPESDQKFAGRQRHAALFNTLLANQAAIDANFITDLVL